MNEVWQNIRNGFATAAPLDQLNLVLGAFGVWLMVRRTLWAFPVGLLAVTVQGILFLQAKIYADALLQAFFFVMLAWGWWHWTHDRGDAPELPITTLSWPKRALTLALAGLATVVAAFLLRKTDARMPWRDAFIAAFSVVGQLLQARKVFENWIFWTVVNVVAVISYWQVDLAYTAFLYTIYLLLGVMGGWAWLKALKKQKNHA